MFDGSGGSVLRVCFKMVRLRLMLFLMFWGVFLGDGCGLCLMMVVKL